MEIDAFVEREDEVYSPLSPFQTVWEKKYYTDKEIRDTRKDSDWDFENVKELQKLINTEVETLIPKDAGDFEFISIGQVIEILNKVIGSAEYEYTELSRRIDSIMNGVDYQFVIRIALSIPSMNYFTIREGYESVSNKAFKQGFRGMSVRDSDVAGIIDLTPEGMLSVWKNAESDARKRCVLDLNIGSQFLPDPAENKKHGKKAAKGEGVAATEAPVEESLTDTTDKTEPEKEQVPPVILSGDDTVDRTEALLNLKKEMKSRKMKSPDVYVLCPTVIGREVKKMKDLTKGELEALTLHISVK